MTNEKRSPIDSIPGAVDVPVARHGGFSEEARLAEDERRENEDERRPIPWRNTFFIGLRSENLYVRSSHWLSREGRPARNQGGPSQLLRRRATRWAAGGSSLARTTRMSPVERLLSSTALQPGVPPATARLPSRARPPRASAAGHPRRRPRSGRDLPRSRRCRPRSCRGRAAHKCWRGARRLRDPLRHRVLREKCVGGVLKR
jgi:hypothetical protein